MNSKKFPKTVCAFLVLCLLCSVALSGCSSPRKQLANSMEAYTQMLETALPEDLRLTIYYMSTDILTLYPYGIDDLVKFAGSHSQTIVVEAEELAAHKELLKKMDASILQPAQRDSYMNARLYYVFEVGDSEKLLEVVVSPEQLGKIYGDVVVNGIAVEDDPVFYELIMPFLTEDAHEKLGI